jgi:AcrR family transcriptional regulator
MPKVVPEYREQAKARIIDAAHEVFRRKGFMETSMADIAKEVGVSKGALYVYFPNKAALLAEMQFAMREKIRERLGSLLEGGDIAEGLARVADQAIEETGDSGVHASLLVEATHSPELRKSLFDDQREDTKVVEAFFTELKARGRIPKVKDVETTAQITIALFMGTVLGKMYFGRDRAEAHRFLVKALRQILGS